MIGEIERMFDEYIRRAGQSSPEISDRFFGSTTGPSPTALDLLDGALGGLGQGAAASPISTPPIVPTTIPEERGIQIAQNGPSTTDQMLEALRALRPPASSGGSGFSMPDFQAARLPDAPAPERAERANDSRVREILEESRPEVIRREDQRQAADFISALFDSDANRDDFFGAISALGSGAMAAEGGIGAGLGGFAKAYADYVSGVKDQGVEEATANEERRIAALRDALGIAERQRQEEQQLNNAQTQAINDLMGQAYQAQVQSQLQLTDMVNRGMLSAADAQAAMARVNADIRGRIDQQLAQTYGGLAQEGMRAENAIDQIRVRGEESRALAAFQNQLQTTGVQNNDTRRLILEAYQQGIDVDRALVAAGIDPALAPTLEPIDLAIALYSNLDPNDVQSGSLLRALPFFGGTAPETFEAGSQLLGLTEERLR